MTDTILGFLLILFALSVFGYNVIKGNFCFNSTHRPLKYVYDEEEFNERKE